VYTVRVSRRFSAAHFIKGKAGRCENVHGHNYRVEVAVSSRDLTRLGMVADFIEIRDGLEKVLPDHVMLNDVFEFTPTAEHLARHFFDEMSKQFPVSSVRVWENEESSAEYQPD